MAKAKDQTISGQASVAPDTGRQRRSGQMSMFLRDAKQRLEIGALDTGKGVTLGQIIGQIWAVNEKQGQLKDGTTTTSLVAVGEFEAIIYHSGEVFTTGNFYLPAYFLEPVKAALDKGLEAVNFAIEVDGVATGKAIPMAYEVRTLAKRAPDNALERMKRDLQAAGRLRLPPPQESGVAALEGAKEPEPLSDEEKAALAAAEEEEKEPAA